MIRPPRRLALTIPGIVVLGGIVICAIDYLGTREALLAGATTDRAHIERALLGGLGLNLLLVLALAGLLVMLLRDQLLIPARRLATTARRFASGDLAARVGMSGHDEVSRAGQAFDRMADDIVTTQHHLEAERHKLLSVLDSLPVGVTLVDRASRRLMFTNARWQQMFGLEVSPGEDMFERLGGAPRRRHSGDPVAFDELAAPQVLRSGRAATSGDLIHLREDGVEVPFVAHAVPVRLGASEDFDAVLTVVLDQREVVALSDEVRSWERRYAKVASATGQIVFEWDLVNRTVRRSGNFICVLGHEAFPDLDREWAYWISRVHPDDRDRVNTYLERVLRSGESFDEEYRFLHGRGHWIVLRDRGFFEYEDGRPVRMYGTMDDVTQHRALEEQFRQAQKMETVGTLAGGIAHDFNNALTGIIGHLALVGDDTPAHDPRARHIQIARQAAERCAELTRGLLAFSRRLDSHPRPTDLAQVVEESIELLRRMLPSTVTLHVDAEPSLPAAMVDPVQAQQVLFNLCVNARDAMPRGGAIRVGVRLIEAESGRASHPDARPGPHLELSVADTGTGIAPETLSRIFEPFFTTKPVGEGTGLGLAMAYGIVRKHHGWIEVESVVGQGSTFRVLLPVAAIAAEPAPKEPARNAPAGAGETVLVADDDALVRDLAATALRGAGFDVLVAGDGEAALALTREYRDRIALVVLDRVMPGQGGAEVLQALRSLMPGVPVVISSGFAPGDAGELEGATAFLPKPWAPAQLLEVVRASLAAPAV